MLNQNQTSPRMDHTSPSQPPLSQASDPGEMQLRVDFYRKLGYSTTEVRTALQKLGLSTDTNSVLGQLVQNRASSAPTAPRPERDETSARHTAPLVAPGHTAPLVTPGHTAPLVTPRHTAPLVTPGHTAPLVTPGHTAPLVTPGHTAPLVTPGHTAPLVTPGHTAPLVTPGHAAPLVTPGHTAPLVTPGHTAPLVTPGHTAPLVTPGHAAPLVTPGHTAPLVTPGHTAPLVTPGHTAPLVTPGRAQLPHRDPPTHPLEDADLKPVVIDGSNVAMSHGNKEVFSCKGIELAVNYFLDRGHINITVFVPSWRKEQPRPDAPITEQYILTELERRKIVVFTPSRRVGGKRVVCYDDRFIVKLAHESDGVIVSNDTYRDLQGERPEWKKCIEERLLMFSFVNDMFMPPDDPLGRHGPSLDNFLRRNPLPPEQKRQLCPYDKKCTYGMKCKFYHPERRRSYRSLADELRENARLSSAEEEKNAAVTPRGPTSDPGPFLNSYPYSLEHELERRLTLDQHGPLGQGQVSENVLQYWDRWGSRGLQGARGQQEWPGMPAPRSNTDPAYASLPHEQRDSGLGSYESQYSDASHDPGKVYRGRPQPAFLSPQPRATHHDRQDVPQPCRCCSHVAPPTGHRRHCSTPSQERYSQPRYDSYSQMPPVAHHYSLPCPAQHSGPAPHQQKYWSEPFQARTARSLPSPLLAPWGPGPPPAAAFHPEREDVRKKLQAIFSPRHVDAVMGMFPHLRNAQDLAAEILNLKSQGVLF